MYSTALRDKTLAKVQEVARRFGAQEKIRSDYTNILYRGRNMYYFYNNAYKGEGLVLASPLTGYNLVSATDHAADYMSEQMIDVPNLDEKHIESLYSKAKWNTPNSSTFVTKRVSRLRSLLQDGKSKLLRHTCCKVLAFRNQQSHALTCILRT